jgi:hypothetical protein
MMQLPDVAQIRYQNAMALFDEFVKNTVKHADAATLRGLEGRFALIVQVQPSYWSQIKSRARQIGERLARQFEQQCKKPYGWMDQVHAPTVAGEGYAQGLGAPHQTMAAPSATPAATTSQGGVPQNSGSSSPQDDDERFIVGLVLTYYRRHPERARNRLLDLLGEVLTPTALAASPSTGGGASGAVAKAGGGAGAAQNMPTQARSPEAAAHALWLRSQVGVAPLKRKK